MQADLLPGAPPAGRAPALFGPATLTVLVLAAYLAVSLVAFHGDPFGFIVLGDGWRDGRPIGEQGYDGQFSYYIALDPRPATAAPHLDVPAYRYQRILYPLLARLAALGQKAAIPWTLVLVNFAAHAAGTALVEKWLVARGANRWYALVYGLWAGLLIAARTDLNEPLCYALVAGAALAHQRGRAWLMALLLLLAALTKETALLFLAAAAASALLQRNVRGLLAGTVSVALYGLFQLWLFGAFGAPGLASGGYLGTPFEIFPYMGLWRIGAVSVPALALLGVILGPIIVLPSLWGIGATLVRLRQRDFDWIVLALGANAGILPFTPFSTFREPLGIIRLASGLVLAVVLFGAHVRSKRILNYSLLWMAVLALLFNG